jgi:hypothetical protein
MLTLLQHSNRLGLNRLLQTINRNFTRSNLCPTPRSNLCLTPHPLSDKP